MIRTMILSALLLSVAATTGAQHITIAKQGHFSVSGQTIQHSGAYDNRKFIGWAEQEETGQSYRADHAFVDLWHDVSDGYPLYKQMKALEKNSPNTLFSYWIEDSLLSHLRWELFHRMSDLLSATAPAGEPVILRPVYTYEQFVACLRNPFLRKLAGTGLL